MKKHVPNILTLFRILLVPVFIYLVYSYSIPNNIFWSLVVFVLASITDYFDGMLARKFEVISNLGKIMDPLADKFLVIAALVALASPHINLIHPIALMIIIIREFAVTIMRNRQAKKNIYIAANVWGKVKTISQMTGIIFSLLYISLFANIGSEIMRPIISGYFWLVVLVTILSGITYFNSGKKTFFKKSTF